MAKNGSVDRRDFLKSAATAGAAMAATAARRAIREHLAAKGVAAKVEPWVHAYHRVIRDDLARWPKVSAIVPTRDHVGVLRTCVTGLLERTDYPDIELIIANNDSVATAGEAFALGSPNQSTPPPASASRSSSRRSILT